METVAPKLTYRVELPGGYDRLRELVLYVCDRCADARRFGKVKLNKILWRADFEAFAQRGVPVSGRPYQRLAAGPAPVEMSTTLAEMESRRLIVIEEVDHGGGYVEHRPRALQKPNLRYFSADDISYVDASIKHYWTKSATAASGLSHGVAWKTREDRDPIPYESVFLSDEKMSLADRKKFAGLGQSRGWKSL